MLAELVHVPVWADDDTNAFALAQQLFGLGRHHRTVGALAIGAPGIAMPMSLAGSHRAAADQSLPFRHRHCHWR
ncbi:MAG: ROK family protein [Mesorhizobium sp.]|nr:MAG: ROK family protein [Mesorhizobium sp.]RWH36463.1 MAG: ROK family protein [Mesorhizobium sp.]TIR58227.1 MAG: ROK family protein [Mesorhizobium sp.]TIR66854.1 MAG: ROK family protein [Mesorhizobium sp.]